jgi:hypothetical protein
MTTASRRDLLTGLGAFAGVGVGLVALDRVGGSSASATPGTVGTHGGLPTTLISRDFRIARERPTLEKMPPRGAPALPYGSLATADGSLVGGFDTNHLPGGREPLHLQTLQLHDGGIVGLGPARPEGTFAIVGATGRYTGSSGSYTVRRASDGASLEFAFETGVEA